LNIVDLGAVQSRAAQCRAVQRSAAQCSAVQRSAAQCSAVQRSAAQCSAVQRSASAVRCSTHTRPARTAHTPPSQVFRFVPAS
jgi:hypothetical protein